MCLSFVYYLATVLVSCVKYTLCTFLLYAYWPVVQNSLPCAFLICVKRHKLSFKIHMRLCFQNLRGAASPPTRRRPASSSWAPATCLWTRRMCGHAVDLPRRIWIPPPPLPLITTARPPGSGLPLTTAGCPHSADNPCTTGAFDFIALNLIGAYFLFFTFFI